jgi:hypothetical protein
VTEESPAVARPPRGGPADPADVPEVAQALDELATLEGLPVDEHAAAYERAHRRLQDAIADADEG